MASWQRRMAPKVVIDWMDDDDDDAEAWTRWQGVIEHRVAADSIAIRWAARQPTI